MNWIDAVILVILVTFVAIGFWKGFVFSILSLFSFLINAAISLFLTRPTTNLFNKWFNLESSLINSFEHKLTKMHSGFNTDMVGMSDSEISKHISTTLNESDFPLQNLFKNMLKVNNEKIADKTSLTLNDIISKSLGTFFSFIITFIILFGLIYLILWLVSLLSKKANEIDSVRITDRILGVIFGIIKGSLTIAFIFSILAFFNEEGLLSDFFTYTKNSAIGSWFYENVDALVDKYLNFQTISKFLK